MEQEKAAFERRESYRIPVTEANVVIRGFGIQDAIKVSDLSAGGAGLILAKDSTPPAEYTPIELDLADYPPFKSKVRAVHVADAVDGAKKVGIQFVDPKEQDLLSLSKYLIDLYTDQGKRLSYRLSSSGSEIEVDEKRAGRLFLHYCITKGNKLQVYRDDVLLPVALKAYKIIKEPEHRLVSAEITQGSKSDLIEGKEHVFTFPGYNSFSYFKADIVHIDNATVYFYVPKTIRQTGFRSSERTRLPEDAAIGLEISHPRLPGRTLTKQIRDVSAEGLSFSMDSEKDILFPGEHIKEMNINLPQGPIKVSAMIRSAHKNPTGSGWGVEMKNIDFKGEKDKDAWQRFVFHTGYPMSHFATDNDVNDIWEILCKTGYIDKETSPELKQHLNHRFHEAWNLHANQTKYSRIIILKKNNKIAGTMAANAIYKGTWLCHHLGIDKTFNHPAPGNSRSLFGFAKELYTGMLFVFKHLSECNYFMAYVDAGKPWSDLLYTHFINQYKAKEQISYCKNVVYKCQTMDLGNTLTISNGISIVDANKSLTNALVRHLKKTLSPVEIDAFSYDKDTIDLSDFSEECSKCSYHRSRCIFFAVKDNRPIAALIAELGDEGVNTFGLFNACWIFYLNKKAQNDSSVTELLLNRAKSHYLINNNKKEFIFFGRLGKEPEDVLKRQNFFYVADGIRWILGAKAISAYGSYTSESMEIVS